MSNNEDIKSLEDTKYIQNKCLNFPNISNRLFAISRLIDGDFVDIGTDHGYLPIYMGMKFLQNNKEHKIIACDYNKKPLEKARENVLKYNLGDVVDIRLANGLEKVSAFEVDIMVSAGMGGNLISSIIENSIEVAKSMKKLICQPQSEIPIFRKNVHNLGFKIVYEEMIYEANQFYNIIVLENGIDAEYSLIDYEFGKLNLLSKTEIFRKYIEFKIDKYTNIIKSVGNSNCEKKEEVESIKELYERVLTTW